MHFALRQRLSRRHLRLIGITLGLGLLLGFAGPFGSNPAYPRPTRYAFWIGLTMAGAVAALAAGAMFSSQRVPGNAARIAAVTVTSAIPMTFIVAWTMAFVQPGRFTSPLQLPSLFVAVAAIQLVIAIAFNLAASSEAPLTALPEGSRETTAAAVEPIGFPATLRSRLPANFPADILALETEDHYLRVHGRATSTLILMRMADALAVLDLGLGLQVHRRWWVNRTAVVGLERGSSGLCLRLVDGRLIPVGRTFAAATRARFSSDRRSMEDVRG